MSILQQVIEEYAISESPEAVTDKRVNSPGALTDKTDKRSSVSSVSEWSEHFEIKSEDFKDDELAVANEMLEIMKMREKGEIPDHYTSTTKCNHCGPVPIWEGCPPQVLGCPWCLNRFAGQPVPKVRS